MRAGQLRERVEILYAAQAQNSYGEPAQDWANATVTATVWGQLTPLMAQAREAFATVAEQLQAKAPYQVRLRYRAGLSTVTNRLRVDGRVFEILAVLDPEGRERETVVMCYEVQA
jgi:SPP1 family predicted phage head-tail adaptor